MEASFVTRRRPTKTGFRIARAPPIASSYWNGRPSRRFQIHDELLLEVPEAEAEQAPALLKTVMEGALPPPGGELGRRALAG